MGSKSLKKTQKSFFFLKLVVHKEWVFTSKPEMNEPSKTLLIYNKS